MSAAHRDLAVGVDIGGTNCKAALVDGRGRLHGHRSFAVDQAAGIGRFMDMLFSCIDGLDAGQAAGIGVLLPGYLNPERTVPRIMVNIPMLEGAPLHRTLRERYGVPVSLDIDRNGPARAEHLFHYPEVARLMYVTIGTGVGVGIVTGGEILRVCNDSIGELGHVTLEPGGEPCSCGNLGCVETLVSRRGVALIARRLETGAGSDPRELYLAAKAGDRGARRVFEEFVDLLGAALVTYANTFSPDLVVVGGGLAGAADLFLSRAESYLNRRWFERKIKRIPVRRSGFGEHAGVIGAASLVLT
jgi:glucokinase